MDDVVIGIGILYVVYSSEYITIYGIEFDFGQVAEKIMPR